MRRTGAIVRPPPSTLAAGLTSAAGGPPDVALARVQHAAYCRALVDCGLAVTALHEDPAHPDSCFVEDAAIVTARGAIATRPGAPGRRGEVDGIVAALRPLYAEMACIAAPGTLDGGDVCEADGHFLVGLSGRTNEAGARQLAEWLEGIGYRASIVDIRGCRRLLHLKSGMSYLGDGRMVLAPDTPAVDALRPYELIVVAEEERFAANCLRLNDRVLMASGAPRLAARVAALGYETGLLELSEFRKMDGALSCLSLRF